MTFKVFRIARMSFLMQKTLSGPILPTARETFAPSKVDRPPEGQSLNVQKDPDDDGKSV